MPRDVIFIALAVGLYWWLKRTYGDRDGFASDYPNNYFRIATVALALLLIFGTPYWGTKSPGSLFERDEYEGLFYVNLFPNGQTVKGYHVPAVIGASVGKNGITSGELGRSRDYRIDAAFLQGGTIYFGERYESLALGEIIKVYDLSGREWGVELTKRRAKQKKESR